MATSEDDEKKRGPVVLNSTSMMKTRSLHGNYLCNQVLLPALLCIEPVVAVFCGQESDSCESFDIFNKNDKLTKKVVPIQRSCRISSRGLAGSCRGSAQYEQMQTWATHCRRNQEAFGCGTHWNHLHSPSRIFLQLKITFSYNNEHLAT